MSREPREPVAIVRDVELAAELHLPPLRPRQPRMPMVDPLDDPQVDLAGDLGQTEVVLA